MTGFGAASASEGAVAARVEARSVNHRHLQVKVRVPSELSALEGEIEARVRELLERGSVTVSVELSRPSRGASGRIDPEVARRYRDELVGLASSLGMPPRVEIADLLGLPGVVVTSEDAGGDDVAPQLVRRALDGALRELVAMREREGASLVKELARHGGEIRKIAAKLEERAPRALAEQQAAFEARIATLVERSKLSSGSRESLEPAALAREVALLADKMDAAEEFARLSSHLEQLTKLLASQQPIGRQLDFLAQEFFREANTIGSKAADASMAHLVVEMKTWIERLREQVQNVE